MKYSIIICTYNRDNFLIETLLNLEIIIGNRRDVEILVIDNNSTDTTMALTNRFVQKDNRFKYYHEKRQGLSVARNSGIAISNGEILVFLDDDVELEENYLKILDKTFARKEIDLIGGKVLPFNVEIPQWLPTKFYYLASVFDLGNKEHITQYVMGANYAMRKSVPERVGLYNESLGRKGSNLMGGEENEFMDRAREKGYLVYYIPSLIVLHKINNKLNTKYIYEYAYSNGKSARITYENLNRKKFLLKYLKSVFVLGFFFLFEKFILKLKSKEYFIINKYNSLGFVSHN